jgi:hypothetical protein
MTESDLDKLGSFLMTNLRDRGISFAETALDGAWKAPSLIKLQQQLASLSPEQKELVLDCVARSIDHSIHDFLFALTEQRDKVELSINGHDAVPLSDGLHGEAYGEQGWIHRFSKYRDVGRK